MKKLFLLGIFAILTLTITIGSVFASCYSVQQNGWCPALSCPQPPQYLYGIYAGDGDTSTLGCVAGKWTCLTEYCPPSGTCSCINEPAWWMYTSGATGPNDGNSDVCNSVTAGEASTTKICWGGTTMGEIHMDNGWDADERELVAGCYYSAQAGASGNGIFEEGVDVSGISKVGVFEADVSGIEITQSIEPQGSPLHWKYLTFDGSNTLTFCPVTACLGTPKPHDYCVMKHIPQDYAPDLWYWDCLTPSIWLVSVCEQATCGAAAACDNLSPGAGLSTCTAYGASYFADGCTIDCMVGEDPSTCRSSAYASGCTASADCNGVAPNADITKCTNGNAYFADKCTSTCSAVDRGDNICRSSTFASGCTAAGSCNGLTPGTNINSCNNGGQTYFADKCNSGCGVEDRDSICRSSAFASGCTALTECNGLTPGTNINTCNKGGQTYFADKCSSTCGGQDRGDNICRSSTFASGCTATSQCNGKSPGSDGSNDWECNSLGDPSTSANQQCWCSGSCGVVNDGCESKYGCSATCDEKSPGEDLPSCSLAGKTYFADECGTGDCLLKDRDNICRSSAFASDCTADSQCNGVAVGSGSCDSSCHYMPSCTCSAWQPTFECCGPQTNQKERWVRTCTPAGCSYESKCEGYCFI